MSDNTTTELRGTVVSHSQDVQGRWWSGIEVADHPAGEFPNFGRFYVQGKLEKGSHVWLIVTNEHYTGALAPSDEELFQHYHEQADCIEEHQ